MKQVTEKGIDYLLIKVPDWAKGYKYATPVNKAAPAIFFYEAKNCSGRMDFKLTPPGQWQILGKATEITEEVAKEIVEKISGNGKTTKFKNYSPDNSLQIHWLTHPTESLLSFVRHHGFEPGECLVLRKQ